MRVIARSCVLVLLVCAIRASADAAPPVGRKSIRVTTIVEVAEAFTDCVFLEVTPQFVYNGRTYEGRTPYTRATGPPPTLVGWTYKEVSIRPGDPYRFDSGRSPQLLAIPRAEVAKYPDRDQLRDLVVKEKVPGAAWKDSRDSVSVSDEDPRTEVTHRWRIERNSTGDGFVFASDVGNNYPDEWPVAERPSSPWRRIGIGMAVFAGGCGLAIWLFRRMRGSKEITR